MKLALWAIFAATLGAYICPALRDPDLGWHVTAGRWMIANRTVPLVDYWNLYAAGTPWIAYSWSHEVVYALFDRWMGMQGLLLLQLLLAIAVSLSLFYGLGRLARDWFFGGVLGILVVVGSFSHFGLRPQTVVWIFFLGIILIADNIYREGFSWKRGLQTGILMMLWANSHITTALGLVVLVAWLFDPKRPGAVVAPLACAFAGTLVTPYFGSEWLVFLGKTGHPISYSFIAEFTPATILEYSTGLLILLLVLLLVFLYHRPGGTTFPRLAICTIFTIGALAVIKFVPFAMVVLAATCAQLWRDSKKVDESFPLGNLQEAIGQLRLHFDKFIGVGLIFMIICVLVLNIRSLWRAPMDTQIVAADAVSFIKTNKLERPLMNGFGEGGFLMYQFSDENGNTSEKVTIDGRTNVNPPDITETYSTAFNGSQAWQNYFRIVKPQTVLWKNRSPLTAILIATKEWCRVFKNGSPSEGFSVFITREQATRRNFVLQPSSGCDDITGGRPRE